MIFKSLTVINLQDHLAKRIDFLPGLNIILGKNKTGKSSLIKSIFYTMGCKVFFEDSWLKIIDELHLEFSFDNKNYILKRISNTENYTLLDLQTSKIVFQTIDYKTFCKKFFELFDINFYLNEKKSKKEIPVPPAAIFNFNYIDQDRGWNLDLANNFYNLSYIQDVNRTVVKYVVGETTNNYFKLKIKNNTLKYEIENYKNEILSINKFLTRVQHQVPQKVELQTDWLQQSELENLQFLKESIRLKSFKINEIENFLKELRDSIKYLKLNIAELNKDFDFSTKILENNIHCPTCGTIHTNEPENKFKFLSDINKLSELIHLNRQDIKKLETEKNTLSKELKSLNLEHKNLETFITSSPNYINFIETQKTVGMLNLIRKNTTETEKMEKILKHKEILKSSIKNELESFTTIKRKSFLRNSLKQELLNNVVPLNLESTTNLDLSNYMLIKKNISGSDGPRIILNYYASLYKYNLKRNNYPFNFLIVDTPNQQGQDELNLKIIDNFIGELDPSGQIILGTERRIGYEKNSHVIHLQNNKRQCLNKEDYDYHLKLLQTLKVSLTSQ